MDQDLDQQYTSICSAATLQSDKKGFFQSFADSVECIASQQWLQQFSQLTSDTSRLLKCYDDSEHELYEVIHGVLQNVIPLYRGKSAPLSRLRRKDGEKAASKGKLEQGLLLLTQSVIKAPRPGMDISIDDGFSLPKALWSRAQLLWQLSEHELCLADLQISLKEKISDNLRVEVYWMMAQCYRNLGGTARARVSLLVALKLLKPEDSNWKERVEAELSVLSSDKEETAHKKQFQVEENIKKEELLDQEHSELAGLSSALAVQCDEKSGRYVVAGQPISSGDVLAVEAPYTACLLPSKFGSHCHHCFKRLRSAVACNQCAGLAFCSVKCKENAHSYHKYECQYLDLMIGSGMSILCHIALRTITQQNYQYWQKVYNKQPVTPDYNRMASLVTHADKRQPKDFLNRTLMALLLLKILERSHYIPSSDVYEGKLSGIQLFLASVLLHLLQCLQFNAHEIYETMYKAELDFARSKINYIAVGVYSSVALFNHDCYPAVTRYFRGKELVIRAVRPLKPGQLVAENYGPVFTMRSKEERQRCLAGRYWFYCSCTACKEDWPKLTELDENMLHIRCKIKDCSGFVSVHKETNLKKSKCPVCSVFVNVAETLMLSKSYDKDYSHGEVLMKEGQLENAAKMFSAYLDQMHVVFRPPNKKCSVAQEYLRGCLAYHHNKYIVK